MAASLGINRGEKWNPKGEKNSKQVSISGPLPYARHFFYSFLIYFCAMKGMVLAEHKAHRFSPVRAVFFLLIKTGRIFRELHQSSQPSSHGMGLERFELVLRSARRSFWFWQDAVFPLPRRWGLSVEKAEGESKRLPPR